MTTNPPLEEGDELLCPHCRRWHPVTAWHTLGTNYTQAMLYWRCRNYSALNELSATEAHGPMRQ